MSEQRLSEAEGRVRDLEIGHAELVVEMRHMSDAISKLTGSVDSLRSSMDKGKGALWVIVGASSVAGGILATIISNFFGKGS